MIGTIIASIGNSALQYAAPYLYAAIGETIGQRSGLLNLGVEGIMLMGGYIAFFIVTVTESLLLAIVGAVIMGVIFGLITAFLNVTLKAEQGISGIGVYIFGLGLSTFLFGITIGDVRTINGFPDLRLPGISSIPIVGEILTQNALVYAAFLLAPLAWYFLNKTPFGLKIQAVGQRPQAADSLGVNVSRVRYITAIIGGILASIAGASLSIGVLNVFQQNLTSGMGFIAVALVYFGGWKVYQVVLGCLLFSAIDGLKSWLQVAGVGIPSEFTLMLPYVVILIVLATMARKRVYSPDALTEPFERGEG